MPSAALVDFPLLRGLALYFYHVANKKGIGIFEKKKRLPGLKPGS
jgi:hypothetical protein